MDEQQYPGRIGDSFYGLQKQTPSYQTEFPHDLPYDPGATSGLFELNYFPTSGSGWTVLVVLVLVVLVTLLKVKTKNIGALVLVIALTVNLIGPIRLPSFMPFNTVSGLVKGLMLILALYTMVRMFRDKSISDISRTRSFLPICVYGLSLLSSVLVMTNPNFFLQDFSIILVGFLFYIFSFLYFDWSNVISLHRLWARLLVVPSALVLYIFLDHAGGMNIVTLLFQRYENFVFLHDLNRGRIFSVIDFEYYVPSLAALLLHSSNKRHSKVFGRVQFVFLLAISLAAILLVNYRYRFLTFAIGLACIIFFGGKYARFIRRAVVWTVALTGVLYVGISVVLSRPTIVDRFLIRDYAEDWVSIDRRFVMYRQAWDLFLQAPFLGVGLGNYKDNVQIVYSRYGGRSYEPYYKILQNVYAYPHNWFLTVLAENGVIGFFILIVLLYVFLKTDIRVYRRLRGDQRTVLVITSAISWLYVFANMFTMMHVALPVVIAFWSTRGMVDRMDIESAGLVEQIHSLTDEPTRHALRNSAGQKRV